MNIQHYPEHGGNRWFVKTAWFRSPKRGEYYLPGASSKVYQARGNLPNSFHIMRLADSQPPKEIECNGLTSGGSDD